jgi:hypothetical protein
MALTAPELRHFVRGALVAATGTADPDRPRLTSAFNTLCDSLREKLQPLFGTTAVTALFARALHLATLEFPWLREVIRRNGDGCSAEVTDALQELHGDNLQAGLAAVLTHDIGLLSTFVGEDLVLPLVQQAWGMANRGGRSPAPRSEGDDQ